jgi:hypothetical protein
MLPTNRVQVSDRWVDPFSGSGRRAGPRSASPIKCRIVSSLIALLISRWPLCESKSDLEPVKYVIMAELPWNETEATLERRIEPDVC